MTIELWITLAAANFAAYLAPGQNMAYIGAATARSGLPGGVAAVIGILASELIWTGIAMALILTARDIDANAMLVFQGGGGLVLVWSGLRVLRSSSEGTNAVRVVSGYGRTALLGVWVGLANPLALIFFVSIFPGIVSVSGAQSVTDMLLFCGSAILVSSLAALTPYLTIAQMLVLVGHSRVLNTMSGGALLGIGVLAIVWTTM